MCIFSQLLDPESCPVYSTTLLSSPQVYKSTSFEKHTTVAAVEAVGSRVTFTIWDTTGELKRESLT